MRRRHRDIFSTVKTEGNLLPVDFLQRLAEGDKDIKGVSPDTFHLPKNEKLNEVINRAWVRCEGAWRSFETEAETLPDSDAGTTLTRERWLLVLFQELGYGRLLTSKAFEIDGKRYPISHTWYHTPIHLVSFRQDLDLRTPGMAGAARMSPHSMIQEFLNRSEEHLWGIVSNGKRLRLFRDNKSLTRDAYVEFDLEGMMNGEAYSDFSLLYLLLHQSRVEAERPEKCWLEHWTQEAQTRGTRALDLLRGGVENAIAALGQGFIAHPANTKLRERLQSGKLSTLEYYQQLLRLVYRMIFLFVSEDRNLLLRRDAPSEARKLYIDHYSITRLRRIAGKIRGTKHGDLWHGLRVTFQCLASGSSNLGLNPLGGFLFSENALAEFKEYELENKTLLAAVRSLSYIQYNRLLRPIDYRNLGTEELGSVYESLLELHPEMNTSAYTFELKVAAGSERKTTGSYYTHASLIHCLLDSALEPVIRRAIKSTNPEKSLLELNVVDPACGSGHFLIAVSHRIGKHLAMLRTGEIEPPPDERRKAIRDVVSHCIYGVDLNPLAVELCKVALWIEALDPGKPLGFLDHHIKCGNSLIGATPDLLDKGIPDDAFKPVEGDDKKVAAFIRKKNREERRGQRDLFAPIEKLPDFQKAAEAFTEWERLPEDAIDQVQEKVEKYGSIVDNASYKHQKQVADLWTAAFFWPITEDTVSTIPTEDVFRQFKKSIVNLKETMQMRLEELAKNKRFFHWYLEFPEIFQSKKGFDCVIGNPPWEAEELVEKEYFEIIVPEIASVRTKAKRSQLIEKLADSNPIIYKQWKLERRKYATRSKLYKESRIFPLGSRGMLNTYRLFAELGSLLINENGRFAQVLKTGIVTAQDSQPLFQKWAMNNQIVSCYDFINTKAIFPDVVGNERFCLLTLEGNKNPVDEAKYAFGLTEPDQTKDETKIIKIKSDSLKFINPEDYSIPPVSGPRDFELLLKIHKNSSILRSDKVKWNPWQVHYTQGHLNSASGSTLFRDFTFEELISKNGKLRKDNTIEIKNELYLPLYEGKLIGQLNHRFGTFEGVPSNKRFGIKAEPNDPSNEDLNNPEYEILPRYWIKYEDADELFRKKATNYGWIFCFRDVCRAIVDARTVQACIIPKLPCLDGCPILVFESNISEAAISALILNALWSPFIFDYAARQKIHGAHLTKAIAYQLPIPTPEKFDSSFLGDTYSNFIIPRSLELTVVINSLLPLARACNYNGPPFFWDDDRRLLLRCELDSAFFHLYGIGEDEVKYVLETFPIFKRKEKQKYGEFKSKRLILDCYKSMENAKLSNSQYKTILTPKPVNIKSTLINQ